MYKKYVKRGLDIAFSLTALLLLSPLFFCWRYWCAAGWARLCCFGRSGRGRMAGYLLYVNSAL